MSLPRDSVSPPVVTEPRATRSLLGRRAVLFGTGLLLWLSTVVWPLTTGSLGNEDSWVQVLHYGFVHGWQWGRDVIFTYGPLGFLMTFEYVPETFPWIVAWNLVGHGICIALLINAASQLKWRIGTAVLVGLLLIYSCFEVAFGRDHLYLVCLWAACCVHIISRSPSRLVPIAICVVGTLLSLAKFTFFTVHLAFMGALLVNAWVIAGWRRSVEWCCVTIAVGLGAWLACGQNLTGIIPHLRSSVEIARGYSFAMMGPFSNSLDLGLAAVVGTGLLALFALRTRDTGTAIPKWLTAGVTAVVAFLVWKHGFVRQDAHSFVFFSVVSCLACIAWMEPSASPRWSRGKTIVAAAVIGLSLLGALRRVAGDEVWQEVAYVPIRLGKHILAQSQLALHLPSHAAALAERRIAVREADGIADLRERVGKEPVAWLMNSQSVPLVSGLSLYPRGVIQSYSAYTEWLANENAKCFRAESRPRYAAVRLDIMDRRVPMGDDGPALLELLARYRPVSNYGGAVLFERRDAAEIGDVLGDTILDREIEIDEMFELPVSSDTWVAASLDVRSTRWGSIRRTLYKSPQVGMYVEANDRKRYDFQLITDMCHAWFLLDPLVTDNGDLAKLAAGSPARRTARIRLHVEEGGHSCFQKSVGLRLRKYRPLPSIQGSALDRLLYPALFARPVEVVSPLEWIGLLHGHSLYGLYAPGMAKLPLPKGAKRVRGRFGQVEQPTDETLKRFGVLFEIQFQSAAGKAPVILMRRQLNPWTTPADRGEQPFELSLAGEDVGSGGWLTLVTNAGTSSTGGCYWVDVRCD